MNVLRRHTILITVLWAIAIATLDTVIPLHFLVTDHTAPVCNADGHGCCNTTRTDCVICQFDLFIGYPGNFDFSVYRYDVLVFENVVSSVCAPETETLFFASLRAPPADLV